MQCKDIPDIPVLKYLQQHKGHWCNWNGSNNNIVEAMPVGIPKKLVLAKMRQLIKRKLVVVPAGVVVILKLQKMAVHF